MEAIFVPAIGLPDRFIVENGLEPLQDAVGGYIEQLTLSNKVVCILNEEGKLLKLSKNPLATFLAHMFGYIGVQDYISGDVLILGRDETGELTTVPDFMWDVVADCTRGLAALSQHFTEES
jgi:hypothetical protein